MNKATLFAEYGAYHADPRNRACHAVGIPLIVLGALGLLSFVRVGPADLAQLAAIALVAFYATLSLRGAVISLPVFVVLYLIAVHLSWQTDVAAFVAGWVFQLIGHRFEGTKPKFLENALYLLIGPLYIFEELAGTAGRAPR